MNAGASLRRLATECADLAMLLSGSTHSSSPPPKVPTVRYGRTGINMPIVSLGCMRFQQTWNSESVSSSKQVDGKCQDNLIRILRHAVKCGINHIETAKAYGCSEMQIGMALRTLFDEGTCHRKDVIIQTKGGISSSTTKRDYKIQIQDQIERLGLDYVDLFSVHGANTLDHHHWLFHRSEEDGGKLIEAVRELRDEGKVRWIGFSTHAPAHVIRGLIETDAFDYVNRKYYCIPLCHHCHYHPPPPNFVTKNKTHSSLPRCSRRVLSSVHYHFMGSYTASGDGDANFEGNLDNVRLAHEHDMGVFAISAFDKGGRLYAPSHLSRELTLPEMEPMEYGAAWLWHHDRHRLGGGVDAPPAPVHTIVCGAARPSDLDQPILAALRSITDDGIADFEAVQSRIRDRTNRVLGEEWASTWQVGLPNYTQSNDRGFQIGNMVWLYNVIKVYGMLNFAKDRYATMIGNSSKWDPDKTWRENVFASPGFNWMPGCAFDPSHDYSPDLKDVPERNRARVVEAMEFVHLWCCPTKSKLMFLEAGVDEEKKEEDDGERMLIPLEWQVAYDMRPWTAFPERG
jgi:predicted aldo/keto reductase-like oxidoreductase